MDEDSIYSLFMEHEINLSIEPIPAIQFLYEKSYEVKNILGYGM